MKQSNKKCKLNIRKTMYIYLKEITFYFAILKTYSTLYTVYVKLWISKAREISYVPTCTKCAKCKA